MTMTDREGTAIGVVEVVPYRTSIDLFLVIGMFVVVLSVTAGVDRCSDRVCQYLLIISPAVQWSMRVRFLLDS